MSLRSSWTSPTLGPGKILWDIDQTQVASWAKRLNSTWPKAGRSPCQMRRKRNMQSSDESWARVLAYVHSHPYQLLSLASRTIRASVLFVSELMCLRRWTDTQREQMLMRFLARTAICVSRCQSLANTLTYYFRGCMRTARMGKRHLILCIGSTTQHSISVCPIPAGAGFKQRGASWAMHSGVVYRSAPCIPPTIHFGGVPDW